MTDLAVAGLAVTDGGSGRGVLAGAVRRCRAAETTTPPSQAPRALATLSEAWFIAAPIVCASPATSISRICRLVTSTEPDTVSANALSMPARSHCAVTVKATRTSTIAIEESSRDLRIDQSARRPPSGVPTTMPRPRASR